MPLSLRLLADYGHSLRFFYGVSSFGIGTGSDFSKISEVLLRDVSWILEIFSKECNLDWVYEWNEVSFFSIISSFFVKSEEDLSKILYLPMCRVLRSLITFLRLSLNISLGLEVCALDINPSNCHWGVNY